MKEYFKKSIERLYVYIKKHQFVECLPDMDDILKKCDELDGDTATMRLGLSEIYMMIQECLIKFSEI
ncbi:hypothetical protein THOM_1490 [Trachipleistophora hominis]|uniref:Uncharacterized protein n=1 Tax=Trachipleistophora hominis TaxID=72359 RepID=L7JXS3_TRAHO|nr:hypothetical protein THOM_1490 [Trachipleistophora hominis]